MNKAKVKNLLIALLSMSAIFLTIELWFEGISNHNFFYTFFSSKKIYAEETRGYSLIVPYRIVINAGNNKFYIIYNDILKSPQMDIFNEVMDNTNNFRYIEEKQVDWDYIYSQKYFSYQYNFNIKSSDFFENTKSKKIPTELEGKEFDSVVIMPQINRSEYTKILFVSGETYVMYELDDANINVYSSSFDPPPNQLEYESSSELNLPIFEKGFYLPRINDGYKFNIVAMINPYYNDENNISYIDRKVDVFFDNSAQKNAYRYFIDVPSEENPGETEEIPYYYLYTNGANKTIKYYLNNKWLLEYDDYTSMPTLNTTLSQDYNTAVSFLLNDRYYINENEKDSKDVTNEFFLSQYTEEEDKTIFYFDYAINDFPIYLSEDLKSKMGMNNHIEITVEKGNVVKYRKAALRYELTKSTATADVSYIDAMDNIFENFDNSDELIENMRFAYRSELNQTASNYETTILYWFIDLNGVTMAQPSQSN